MSTNRSFSQPPPNVNVTSRLTYVVRTYKQTNVTPSACTAPCQTPSHDPRPHATPFRSRVPSQARDSHPPLPNGRKAQHAATRPLSLAAAPPRLARLASPLHLALPPGHHVAHPRRVEGVGGALGAGHAGARVAARGRGPRPRPQRRRRQQRLGVVVCSGGRGGALRRRGLARGRPEAWD